jgi:hypothetical protein
LDTDQLTTQSGFRQHPDNGLGIDFWLIIRTRIDSQETIFVFQIQAPPTDAPERTQAAGRPVRSLTGVDVGAKE